MSGIVRSNNTSQSGVVANAETIDSDDFVDGSIDNAHIADNAIDSEHYTDGSIDNAHLADDAVDSDELAAGAVDTAHIGNLQVTTAKIAGDAIDGTKLADDAVDSEHYTDGSIDTAHIADNQVTLAKMNGITRGSIIIGDSSGNPAALAIGGNTYVLTSDATDIAWAAASSGPGQAAVSHIKAGTNQDTYIPPDLVSQAPNLCKGWVMRSGNGTVEVSGGNIASIDDTGVGDGTINFTASMTATGYGMSLVQQDDNGYLNQGGFSSRDADSVQIKFRHFTGFTTGALYDAPQAIGIFGNLA